MAMLLFNQLAYIFNTNYLFSDASDKLCSLTFWIAVYCADESACATSAFGT